MRMFNVTGAAATERVKPPNVAGMFYPGDGDALRREVDAPSGGLSRRERRPRR